MKKYILNSICLILLLGLMLPASAAPAKKPASKGKASSSQQWAKNKLDLHQIHNVAFWGGVGYTGLVNNYDYRNASKFIGGGGGILGVGYEWHYKKFMLNIGPELRIFSSKDKINFADGENPFEIDGTNPASPYVLPGQTKRYDFHNTSETQAVGQLMLPILAGAQFNDFTVPLYFLAGVKIGYTLFDSYTQRAEIRSTLHDRSAFDPSWTDVRDLGLTDFKAKGTNQLGLDVALSAEVGVNLNTYFGAEWNENNEAREHPWHLRAALFIDYGLPIMDLGTAAPMMHKTEKEMVSDRSLHTSEYATGKLNSLIVGAKFTAVLQLTKPKQMKPQNPYLVLQLVNARTGQPMVGNDARLNTNIEIKNLKNGRVMRRVPNNKGMIIQRSAPGDYEVSVAKEGFLPYQPFQTELMYGVNTNLKQKIDTTKILLYPEPIFSCRVFDLKTGEPINAKISVIDTTTLAEVKQFSHSSLSAKASTKLPVGEAYYSAMVEAKDHKTRIFPVGVQGLDDIYMEFVLEPIVRGKSFVIRNLFFASDKTDILPESEPAMQELFEFLNENPDVRILITGHTDWIGTDKDNQILSEGRANSVKRSMVERGIDPERIETEGLGESQPIDTNETEEGRQNNRRVEFTIL